MDSFVETLEKLKEAARMEEWDLVDLTLSTIKLGREYYGWAFEQGINPRKELNVDVRDLAASIIEKAEIPSEEFRAMQSAMFTRMERDNNKYVRFRSAFALANHGPGQYLKEVISTLKEASMDKDVGAIAKDYLDKVRPKRVATR